MALKEGFRRIRTVARVLGMTGSFLLVLSLVGMHWRSRSPGIARLTLTVFLIGELGVILPLLGGILATVAWIGEGFADKPYQE